MPSDTFVSLPDPAPAAGVDELVERLRMLKVWAGDPSYETIKDRINAAWRAAGRPASELTRRSTVANCFQPGRRRLNSDLVLAVVEALHADTGYVSQWRQALRVVGGEIEAVAQVRVQDTLPRDLAGFTGRDGELDRLRHARKAGDAVVISAIEGMAGVGKTQLAVHAGHVLHAEKPFDRVLFVNLRGFHPDATQPPADPAAVLDGFLRLLGVPGQQIPHDLAGCMAAYRQRLAGLQALVVLDNAATADQVRPLLPGAPGCLTLVTSRRSLADLRPGSRLAVGVFTPEEAAAFLAQALPGETDRAALARIAQRCGYLPLALSLIAGHIRNTPGWTLTDHADRLDERHRERRLDTGVELALTLSYQHLPSDQQRLLRLAALHPGQDFDAYAAAALAGTDLQTAGTGLDHLRRDNLLQPAGPGRCTFHDLVRAYAAGRAYDEDPPAARRDALTRLFDHYLATSAAAMNAIYPAHAHQRPQVDPAASPAPDMSGPETAVTWLDTERPTLVAVAAHTANNGWPRHTTRLARTISRYINGSHHTDTLAMQGHVHRAAQELDDPAALAHALLDLGVAQVRLGQTGPAVDNLRQAVSIFQQTDDLSGHARAVYNLGVVAERSGDLQPAYDHIRQARTLYRRAGDQVGEAKAVSGLGITLHGLGRYLEAADCQREALKMARRTGNRDSEAHALTSLADNEMMAGILGSAADHLDQARALYLQLGNRDGQATVLDSFGVLQTRLGHPDQAVDLLTQAIAIFRENGDQIFEASVLNHLGEAHHDAGRLAEAVAHYEAAHALAATIDSRDQQAMADRGLGRTHAARGDHPRAREHYERALAYYAAAGLAAADDIRTRLADLDGG